MTALSQDRASELEHAQLQQENHRLRGLVQACERYEAGLHQRIQELTAANSKHIHALESRGVKVWPVHVKCDSCSSVVAFDPAPGEAELAEALVALGWSGHHCPTCSRRGLSCP